MSRQTSSLLAVFAAVLCLITGPSVRAQDGLMPRDSRNLRIDLTSHDTVVTWEEGSTRVFVLPAGGRVVQGDTRIVAPRMVVWFSTGPSSAGEDTEAIVRVYAEGEGKSGEEPTEPAQLVRPGDHRKLGAAYVTLRSRAAFAWDAPLRREDKRVYSTQLARADAVVAGVEEGDRMWAAIPDPQEVAVEPGMVQLLQAEETMYFREHGASVALGDVHGSYGNMDFRADAAVVWTDEESGNVEVYVEGDVRVTPRAGSTGPGLPGLPEVGLQALLADRLYINPQRSRSEAEGVQLRIKDERTEGGPVYVLRGEKLFVLDEDTFQLDEVSISTCPFVRPHYQLSASRMQLTRNERATPIAIHDVRIQVGETPRTLLWVPFLGTDLSRQSFIITDVAAGTDDKFGAFLQTTWAPMNAFGVDPAWLDYFDVFLDFYSDRGVAIGQETEYRFGTEWESEGMVRSYYINDSGDFDDTGLPVPQDNRGRFHWRHRTRFHPFWRVDAEYYYLSDHGFLEEYFEQDFEEEKQPESYVNLRYLRNSTYAALQVKAQVNDFLTQVEQLPAFALEFMALPFGPLVYDGTFRVGRYDLELSDRIRPVPADPPDLVRAHLDQRLALPFDVWFLRVTPFLRAIATWADEAVEPGGTFGGRADRLLAGGGVDVSATFWRTYDVECDWLNLNRMRHIITPHAGIEHLSLSNDGSRRFVQMDGFDALDEMTESRIGLRNRLQTQRRDADGHWRSVDWLELDLAYVDRDSDSVDPLLDDEFIRADLVWRISDNLSLHSQDNRISMDDGTDIINAGLTVDFMPAVSLRLDYDDIADIARTVTAELTCRLSDRYHLLLYEQYQLDSANQGSGNVETRVALRRFLHEWVLDMGLKIEEGNDGNVAFLIGFGPRGWGIFSDPRRSRR